MQLQAIVSNSGLMQLHTMIGCSVVIRDTTVFWEIHRSGCFPKLVVLKHREINSAYFLLRICGVSSLDFPEDCRLEKHYSKPRSETITAVIT